MCQILLNTFSKSILEFCKHNIKELENVLTNGIYIY